MYIINYKNGITEECEGTLEQAKKIADDGAAYTQSDIVIANKDGEEVAIRRWYGVPYDPDATDDAEDEVIQFGTFGHYSGWLDC